MLRSTQQNLEKKPTVAASATEETMVLFVCLLFDHFCQRSKPDNVQFLLRHTQTTTTCAVTAGNVSKQSHAYNKAGKLMLLLLL